jgi:tetratricopeptide (TPR) repeat protein
MSSIRRSTKKHLDQAESAFYDRDYNKALFHYAIALQHDPASEDAKVGTLLCDLADEMESEAYALFDYYIIAKRDNPKKAKDLVEQLLNSLDGAMSAISSILTPALENRLEQENAISYEDFLHSIERRGSFKKAFEDVMFSTRVIISEKEEFIDFLEKLIDNKFYDMAYLYIENAIGIFPNDKKIRALISKLKSVKKLETTAS